MEITYDNPSDSLEKDTKTLSFCWHLAILVMICSVGVSTLAAMFSDNFTFITLFGQLAILVPITIGAIRLMKEEGLSSIGFTGFNPVLLPILTVLPTMTTIFIQLTCPISVVFALLFGTQTVSNEIAAKVASGALSDGEFLGLLAVISIAPAILEEILCRGIIMSLLKKYGPAVQILISALIFSMLHVEMSALTGTFMMGVLFAVIRITTGSIFASMYAHLANNSVAVLTLYALNTDSEYIYIMGLAYLLIIVIFPFVIYTFVKERDNELSWRKKLSKPVAKAGFSLEMLLVILFVLAYNVLVLVNRFETYDFLGEFSSLIEYGI